jgi:hypothetical protein
MPQTNYTVNFIDPEGLETFSVKDIDIVDSFTINSEFKAFENKIEYHVYSLDGVLLTSDFGYNRQSYLGSSQQDPDGKILEMTIDPVEDIKRYGFSSGDVKVVYNFIDDLYTENKVPVQFFIEEISEDRTELRLLTNQIPDSKVVETTNTIKEDLASTSYLNDFRVNPGNNDLLIGINIDIQPYRDYSSVVVKLYEPLPEQYEIKQSLTIDRIVSDSLGYEILGETIPDEIKIPYLKGPNYNVEDIKGTTVPTPYFNYNELFSFPTNQTYRQLNSLFAEKSIELSADYTDFANYIQFSSAKERIENFQYKLNLVTSYQTSYSASLNANNNAAGVTGSLDYFKTRIDNILKNFDHFDRHLYYGTGSYSWPKQAPYNEPYIVATGSATASVSNLVESASLYDDTNNSRLVNTVPEFLKEDSDNAKYLLFTDMIGQHFDNLWVYTKALSDKYDNDNRPNRGVPKGLVEEVLRNFGVKLYSSNKSIENLFANYTGEFYQTGSESLKATGSWGQGTYLISASNSPISEDLYRKEIYKRIYHNLPLLLKSKGTERGVRALINTFGIPSLNTSGSMGGLLVRSYGGNSTTASVNLGLDFANTSSIGKIKLDNTGSTTTGNTLSQYSSIVQRDGIYDKYSDDIHTVDIGYSPIDVINDKIFDFYTKSGSFNIDNFIGDPNAAYSSSYYNLDSASFQAMSHIITHPTGSDDYGDLVRILKFFDNVLFKSIKDFIPARSNINTGIIIKPHVLNRSKIKQVQATSNQPKTGVSSNYGDNMQITGSIEISQLTGSSGGSFGNIDLEQVIPLTASYTESVMTPDGLRSKTYHDHEEARYDGELSGSHIKNTGELNDENIFKYENPNVIQYKVIDFDDMLVPPTPTPTPTATLTPTPTPTVPAVTPTATPTVTPSSSDLGLETCWRIERCSDAAVFYAPKDRGCINDAAAMLSHNFHAGDYVQFFNFSVGAEACPGGATYCGNIISAATQAPTALISVDDQMSGADPCNDDARCTE